MQEVKKDEFDDIDFTKLDISSIISLCLKCNNEKDAKKVLEQYEKYCDTPEIAHSNLGYIFGYCNEKDRKKLYSLFPVNHPIFGKGFGRGEDLSAEDAFRMGKEWAKNGQRMGKEWAKNGQRMGKEWLEK